MVVGGGGDRYPGNINPSAVALRAQHTSKSICSEHRVD